MKKYFKIYLLLLIFINSSCEKYLEVESYDKISDESTIFDKSSAETALRGAYRALASLNYSSSYQTTILLSGGDIKSLANAQTDLNIINYDLRSDIGFLNTYWSNFYNTINRANHVIEKTPLVNDIKLTTELRNKILGEAYFIRAISYFDLARIYGNVQIFLTPTTKVSDKLGKKQSSQRDVFLQVLSDLNTAETLLTNSVIRNRATKYTVYALRAKVNLYLKKYEEAEIDVNNVLSNDSYKLIKPFKLAGGTSESILELSYSDNERNLGFGLWNTSNRQLEVKPILHSLLNNPNIGGGRKILSVENSLGQFIGGIYPTNTSPAYMIRTAELYFIRAESRLKKVLPNIPEALEDLNAIRQRSDLPLLNINNIDDLLLAIEQEARVEFALEPYRWFELVRTDRAQSVLGVPNASKYIFPIPATELIADPSLVQNINY